MCVPVSLAGCGAAVLECLGGVCLSVCVCVGCPCGDIGGPCGDIASLGTPDREEREGEREKERERQNEKSTQSKGSIKEVC